MKIGARMMFARRPPPPIPIAPKRLYWAGSIFISPAPNIVPQTALKMAPTHAMISAKSSGRV